MGLLNNIYRLFASDCKESALTIQETENENITNNEQTMITKEEMMQIASMVASMLKGETNVTEPTAQVTNNESESENIDTIVDDTLDNSVPTDQDSVMGGDNPLVSNLDNIIDTIKAKVDKPVAEIVKDAATIVEYSDKAVAVYGDTKATARINIIKGYQTLSKSGRPTGAIFRRNLTSIEGQPAGWLISKDNLEAKGGLAVLQASLEATGMAITIGESVKDITTANHEAWEAKRKAESKTDEVPEGKKDNGQRTTDNGKGKGKKNKPSIAPTDEQRKKKDNGQTKDNGQRTTDNGTDNGKDNIVPIVKPKEYKGLLHLTKSAKDWTFTECNGYTRIVNFTDPKGQDGYALLCSGELNGGHYIVIDKDASKELLDCLESDGLAMAIYKKLWTKGVRDNYIAAYAEGGMTEIAKWLEANKAA